MNGRQAAKAAAKKLEEMTYAYKRSAADITAYNQVIDCLIAGGSACGWCQDRDGCQKDKSRGCDEWMLHMSYGSFTEVRMEVERDDEGRSPEAVSEDVHAAGDLRGEGTEDPESETGPL